MARTLLLHPLMRKSPSQAKGFTLVEVVIALAIFAFAGVGLISLFSLGLNTSRDSTEKLLSSNIATSFLATRRASPTNAITDFLLPPLNVAANNETNPVFLTQDGFLAATPNEARLGMIYHIVPPDPTLTSRSFSKVHLCFFWPPQVAPAKAMGRFEITTSISLP